MKIDINEHEGLQEHMKNIPTVPRTFGGIWPGIMWALVVFQTVAVYGAGGSAWLASGVGIVMGTLLFLLLRYDRIFTQLVNQNVREYSIQEYIINNISDFLDPPASQASDSEGNLDGTNGDE